MTTVDRIVRDLGEVETIGLRALLPGRVTQVGLELPDSLTFDEWSAIGSTLRSIEQSVMWWIGDWLRYGERRYGETYAQAVEATGRDVETVRAAKWVAERFPQSVRRRTDLSWSHHEEVAALPAEHADRLLDDAVNKRWSRNDLRREASQVKAARAIDAADPSDTTCTIADLSWLAQQGRKFGTIYADPPWQYDNQVTRAATCNHYRGMSIDELCALPVAALAADDAHLHLWTTNAFLLECSKIFKAWDFELRSTFVWVKPQIGIGNYWRNAHELMLTAVRGDAKRFNDHCLRSWLQCERGAHSEKPEQVRSFIERASPGPYLELFGRKAATGWAVWGNQIERSIFTYDVKKVV